MQECAMVYWCPTPLPAGDPGVVAPKASECAPVAWQREDVPDVVADRGNGDDTMVTKEVEEEDEVIPLSHPIGVLWPVLGRMAA